jgi:hypothetical protein
VTAPANGTKAGAAVWDLETAAAQREGDDTPFPFTYKGKEYVCPPSRRWPARALAALADGQLAVALPALLGQDAWDGLCDDGLDLGQLETLFEKLAAEAGFESVPNSPRPAPPSSRRR